MRNKRYRMVMLASYPVVILVLCHLVVCGEWDLRGSTGSSGRSAHIRGRRLKRAGWCSTINEKAGQNPASHSMWPADGCFMHPKVCTRWFIQSASCHQNLESNAETITWIRIWLRDVNANLVTAACLECHRKAGPSEAQGSGNRIKHHGFGKSFTLISNSLRTLNIIILADVSIPVLN